MLKIKHFTDTDLDGIGCSIVLQTMPLFNNILCEYDRILSNPNYIENDIETYIASSEYKKYDETFITDLSISMELAEKMDKLDHNFVLLDHHVTALPLNKFDWATITVADHDGRLLCGTYLTLDYMREHFKYEPVLISTFVDLVTDWDTFAWVSNNNPLARKLNKLCYTYEFEKFAETMIHRIMLDEDEIMSDQETLIVDILEAEDKSYMDNKINKTGGVIYLN